MNFGEKQFTRRDFIKYVGIGAASLVLAKCAPKPPDQQPINLDPILGECKRRVDARQVCSPVWFDDKTAYKFTSREALIAVNNHFPFIARKLIGDPVYAPTQTDEKQIAQKEGVFTFTSLDGKSGEDSLQVQGPGGVWFMLIKDPDGWKVDYLDNVHKIPAQPVLEKWKETADWEQVNVLKILLDNGLKNASVSASK